MQRIATIFGPALRLAGIVAVALWFTACSNSTSANVVSNAPSPGQTWLFVSDVHFTPFDDPALVTQLIRSPVGRWHAILASSTRPPSPYFNDTNFALFEQDQIAADPSVRSQFFVNYNSASATATPQPSKWSWYWCGHTNLTTGPYAAA